MELLHRELRKCMNLIACLILILFSDTFIRAMGLERATMKTTLTWVLGWVHNVATCYVAQKKVFAKDRAKQLSNTLRRYIFIYLIS